jgi:pimeloyl-ACP methyl ester carboxylesterase
MRYVWAFCAPAGDAGRVDLVLVSHDHHADNLDDGGFVNCEVTGFILRGSGLPVIYISGDNASIAADPEIARRTPVIDAAVLHAGAARVPAKFRGDCGRSRPSGGSPGLARARASEFPGRDPGVVIGHSFGGLIAQKLLGEDLVAAAVAIDSPHVQGDLPLPLSTLRTILPVLKNHEGHVISLTAEQFRYAFGNAVSPEESDALYEKWAIPASTKPLLEAATADFSPRSPAGVDTRAAVRGPLLLITGGRDHAVPEAITKSTFRQYQESPAVTELAGFADRGHSLTIDSGWRAVADECLAWLAKQGQ